MNLLDVSNGDCVKVTRFEAGMGLDIKLRSLGILPGDIAKVIRQAPFGGPILVEIHGREIALGRGVAKKIEVEAEESTPP